ncbi:MAG: cobalamin-binding protein, partial [Chloroflexota bacterium]|nr:cobalamin-binding protein [Chloroflexota bacterium]
MRIVSLPAGANDLLADLGLQAAICGTALGAPRAAAGVPVVARLADGEPSDELPLLVTRPHDHVTRFVVDRAAVGALRPDVLITEEVCPVCLAEYDPLAAGAAVAQTTIDGHEVRLVSLHARRLEDVLAPIVPLAT